jgi:hypothetical protein
MTVPAGEGISQKPESAVHFPVFTLALFRERLSMNLVKTYF